MGAYSAKTLPSIVLTGLDRNESKLGRILLWASLPFVALFVVLFFVSTEPMAAKLPALYLAGMFAVISACALFLSRKRLRVHRSWRESSSPATWWSHSTAAQS